jgi:hypothetical protein
MGRAIILKCIHCGVEHRYQSGLTKLQIMDIKNYLISRSPPADGREIKQIDRKHQIDWKTLSYGYGIRKCPKCAQIASYLNCRFEYDNAKVFESLSECNLCTKPTIPFDYDYTKVRCSKCLKIGVEPVGFLITD